MRYRHDHVFTLDQIFIIHISAAKGELRSPRHREFLFHFGQFRPDDIKHARTRSQNIEIVCNFIRQAFGFIADFISAKPSQTRQLQRQNSPRLLIGKEDRVFPFPTCSPIGDQIEQRSHIHDRPRLLKQTITGGIRIWRMTNNRDDFINVRHSQCQTDQDVCSITGLVQLKLGAAGNNFFTEADERLQDLPQVQLLWSATIKRQDIRWETRPQLRISM